MKLMLVDDEKLTREGLMRAVDWNALGIEKVLQASDGAQGCELASAFQPDIVLSDVRMPHMNGIEMAEKLQELNPCMAVIFMSGYSDKEYLKAAIRLKAVSYVEKPIDIEEVTQALERACESVRAEQEAVRTKEVSENQARSALALRLASAPEPGGPEGDKNVVPGFPFDGDTLFFTFLVKLHSRNLHTPEMLEDMVSSVVERTFRDRGLREIHGSKQEYLIFFHVWRESGNDRGPDSDSEPDWKALLGRELVSALEPLAVRYHIVFGKTVCGAYNIHNSYNSAVIELQNSFFEEENTFRIYEHRDDYREFSDLEQLDVSQRLSDVLLQRDLGGVKTLLEDLRNRLSMEAGSLLPNQVKSLYYKLMTAVSETESLFQLSAADRSRDQGNIWESVSECESLYELHGRLQEQCDRLFSMIRVQSEELSAIYLIKDYIASHYQEETLAIKDISQHVFLSSSYICTLFKNETGKTLNQYITDYRMEQAKRLLVDPRNRITDISAKVGYSDGSYFGKIFKKQVGMSPSEYRDSKIRE